MSDARIQQGEGQPVSADVFCGLLYSLQPDYTRPRLEVPEEAARRIRDKLALLYGSGVLDEVYREVERLMIAHQAHMTPQLIDLERRFDPTERFSERDIILITYGDMVVSADRRPLQTLAEVTEIFFRGIVNTLHILPFFPYSSDRGFSVISYEEVDPRLGSWEEIEELEANFKLMFDAIFNHVSSKSYWFQQFLNGDPDYEDFFIAFNTKGAVDEDRLKLILRPRTSDVLTRFDTIQGPRYVWTTFSSDQVDLNFKNPKVLLKVVEILLYYVRRGVDLLRLDAVTYLWCELGTNCAHLMQTHAIVKLFRAVLDVVSPHVGLVTESNVPHEDNITYFGDGSDEAQMVYNFALPPLVLHTFLTGNAEKLTGWAEEVAPPSKTTAFFNFLDSHDGIGLMGAQGILDPKEIGEMCDRAQERGGFVSSRTGADGRETPYELNVTWFSVLNPEGTGEDVELRVARFVASRAVALVLRGVPGIYLPSMVGARNDERAVSRGGSKRSINRPVIEEARLFALLAKPSSLHAEIARRYVELLQRRVAEPAFHPNAEQRVLHLDRRVFAVLRTPAPAGAAILSLINVSPVPVDVTVAVGELGLGEQLLDLVCGETMAADAGRLRLHLWPYQVAWLKRRS